MASSLSPTLNARTQYVTANNGIRFAYRTLGPSLDSAIPLVLHIHFRGNMDFWDPALLDPIASRRPVVIFDQSGVGRSSGDVADTIQGWADNVIALVDALKLTKIDLLGFSMGGFAVQMVALTRPELVRKLILAGTRSSQHGGGETGAGIVWPREQPPPDVFPVLHKADPDDPAAVENAIAVSFFPHTEEGRAATARYFQRIGARNVPAEPTNLKLLDRKGTGAQVKSLLGWNAYGEKNSWDRLGEIKVPTLVVNGDDDLLIPTSRSWELAKRIENAGLIIYPKSGHGFLWQWAPQFAKDINAFLDDWPASPVKSMI